jgi:hypothetical protein
MRFLKIGLLLFLGIKICAWGQSAAELSRRYSAIEVYEIRPGIWMTPFYATDGRVCELTIEKRHTTRTANKTTIEADSSLSKNLVNDLAPESERGSRLEGLNYGVNTIIDGGFVTTTDTYENVLVETDAVLSESDIDEFRKTFRSSSESAATRNKRASRSSSASVEPIVVVITWRKRQCTAH